MSQPICRIVAAGASSVSLRQILPRAEFLNAADVRFRAVTADSRQVQPGDLFVAQSGSYSDGHDYYAQAASRGAAAILAERPLPVALPQCVVADSRKAYGRVCQALAGWPAKRLKVIGVTGTNGKTTTTCLIASILKAAGYQPGLLGTLGYSDGEEVATAHLTTPEAADIASWFARMANNGCTHAVMEVSSHALAQHRTAGIKFDAACVTNVRQDHLDFHGSLAAYRRTKRRLLKQLLPEGFAVINADCEIAASYLNHLSNPALTVSLQGAGEVTATLVERQASEQTFLLHAGEDTAVVRTQMIGDHHMSNCLVAAAVGLVYGIDLHAIVRGLEGVDFVPGRLERVECGQPFATFVDYAHTPDALEHTLSALRDVTRGKLICVFGAGGDRDRTKRPLMGRTVERLADVAIVTADNPRNEDPSKIARQIIAGCEQPHEVEVINDRQAAIERALRLAEPGDAVVIAGKGHEVVQVVGNRSRHFDDVSVIKQWFAKQFELERKRKRQAA
jgi:UDP-N-acetylmuramoyl-L-alanyl-D-glutamate--2,6-diaminopimelate ligase